MASTRATASTALDSAQLDLPLPLSTLIGLIVGVIAVAIITLLTSGTGDAVAPVRRRSRHGHTRIDPAARKRPFQPEGRRDRAARLPADRRRTYPEPFATRARSTVRRDRGAGGSRPKRQQQANVDALERLAREARRAGRDDRAAARRRRGGRARPRAQRSRQGRDGSHSHARRRDGTRRARAARGRQANTQRGHAVDLGGLGRVGAPASC